MASNPLQFVNEFQEPAPVFNLFAAQKYLETHHSYCPPVQKSQKARLVGAWLTAGVEDDSVLWSTRTSKWSNTKALGAVQTGFHRAQWTIVWTAQVRLFQFCALIFIYNIDLSAGSLRILNPLVMDYLIEQASDGPQLHWCWSFMLTGCFCFFVLISAIHWCLRPKVSSIFSALLLLRGSIWVKIKLENSKWIQLM